MTRQIIYYVQGQSPLTTNVYPLTTLPSNPVMTAYQIRNSGTTTMTAIAAAGSLGSGVNIINSIVLSLQAGFQGLAPIYAGAATYRATVNLYNADGTIKSTLGNGSANVAFRNPTPQTQTITIIVPVASTTVFHATDIIGFTLTVNSDATVLGYTGGTTQMTMTINVISNGGGNVVPANVLPGGAPPFIDKYKPYIIVLVLVVLIMVILVIVWFAIEVPRHEAASR